MGSTSFAVSMYLQAYNRMAPTIQRARQMLRSLGTTGRQVSQQTSSLNPVGGWDKKIDAVIQKMRQLGKESDEVRKKSEWLMGSGFRDLAGAAAIASPSLMALKYSADIQTQATTMEVGGFSKEGIARIKQQSRALSKEMAFDWGQVMGVSLALQKAGMNEAKVMNTQGVTTKYAQLEYNRYGSDPFQTATHLAHIAETAGVLYVTAAEREKHALNTQEKMAAFVVKKYSAMAEYLNRVVTSTSSDTARLSEALKYSMPEGVALGWNAQQVLMMTGVQSRFGIEGSMAGTHLKDFASRLNPFLHYLDEDVGKRSARLSAMLDAGWIKDTVYTTTKAGNKKFYRIGESVFHGQDGNLKGPEEIFKHIFETYKRFQSEGRVLQFKGILHDVLGEQGKDIVNLLNKNPEMIEHLVKDMEKVMSIEQGIARYQKDANSAWDIFKGNIKTVSTMLGDLVLDDFSNSLQSLNQNLFGKGKDTGKIYKWVEEHKDLIKTVLKATFVIAALAAIMGILKIAAGGLMFFLISPFLKGIGWLGKFSTKLLGLKDAFKYFRIKGAGPFEALWKGAQWAFPWLGKLMGWVGRFTPFWLTNATRIAAGWLIAMGPVGWIIAGVTAIIAAAVWAWNNNFLGFRDKCEAVWKWIKDYADYIWPEMSQSIRNFVKAAGETWRDFKNNAKSAFEWVDSTIIKPFTDGWKRYFGGVGEAIEEMISKLSLVRLYNGVKNHFAGFDNWRNARDEAVKSGIAPWEGESGNLKIRGAGEQPFIKGGNKIQTNNMEFKQVINANGRPPQEVGEIVKTAGNPYKNIPGYNPIAAWLK